MMDIQAKIGTIVTPDPVWQVVIDPEYERRIFHVPEAGLDAFLRVLVSNGVDDFRVTRTWEPDDRPATQRRKPAGS